MKFKSRLLVAASVFACSSVMGNIAYAADAAKDNNDTQAGETVVVIGTQIRGAAPVGSAVISLGRADMAKLGAVSTSEILRTVPSVLNLGTDPSRYTSNQKGNANVTYATGINLRGVNTADTLVLVNGRRIAPAGIGAYFIDPNVIPEAAIGRMEVQADGASAIYGSDAVSGVVNIVTRRPFNGADTVLSYTTGKDHSSKLISQTLGRKWDTGGFFVALEHRENTAVKASDFPQYFTDDYRPFGGTDQRSTVSITPNLQIDSTHFRAITAPNTSGGVLTTANLGPITGSATNRQSFYAGGVDAIPKQHRDSVLFNAEQELSNNIKLWTEGFYSRQVFDQHRNAQADGMRSVAIPSTNPYYIVDGNGVGVTTPETFTYSGLAAFGPVHNTGDEWALNFSTGLKIDLGFKNWQVEPYISYSADANSRLVEGNFNNCALNGNNGSGFTAFGTACAGTPAVNGTTLSTAFNPTSAGPQSASVLDRLRATNLDEIKYVRNMAGIRADGELFELPGGTVKLAVGVEYMRDKMTHYQQRNDGAFTPSNREYFILDGSEQRENYSGYLELNIPLVGEANAMPGIQRLTLSLAGRVDDYSDFGTTTNPKIGINYQPIEDLRFHASYGTSFRAPTLSDNSSNVVGTRQYSTSQFGNTAYTSVAGVTVTGGQTKGILLFGGNPDVTPETSTTYSFGVDYKPHMISGLTMGVNYFSLEVENQLNTITFPAALSDSSLRSFVILPTDPGFAALRASLCASPFNISPDCLTGEVIVDGRTNNLGVVKTSGFEFNANYAFDTGFGNWNVGIVGQYLTEFGQSAIAGAPVLDSVNIVNFPLRFTARGNIGWSMGGWAANAFINYQNAYKYGRQLSNTTGGANTKIDSSTTIDLNVSYDTGEDSKFGAALNNVKFSIRATNLFDQDPHYVEYRGSQGSTPYFTYDPNNASALGREVTFRISKSF